MLTVNFLAQLWGFSLVIISFSILLRPKYINLFFSFIEEERNLPLFGAINIVIGVALILFYNVWTWQWPVVITILGWAVLIRGMALLLIPETVQDIARNAKRANWIQPILAALVSLGCWLAYMGIFR